MLRLAGIGVSTALACLDYVWEYYYQRYKFNAVNEMALIPKDMTTDHTHEALDKCSKELMIDIKHHLVFILSQSIVISVMALVPRYLTSICNTLGKLSATIFPSYRGIGSHEILLLHLQQYMIIKAEYKHIYDKLYDLIIEKNVGFMKNEIIKHIVWNLLILVIIAPLVVRFKILIEKKFHAKAPLVFAALSTIISLASPLALFYINLLRAITKQAHEQAHGEVKPFKLYIINSLASAQSFYNIIKTPFDPLLILSKQLFMNNKEFKSIYELALIECNNSHYALNALMVLGNNFIFAILFMIFDKYCVKSFCSKHIQHTTAHLVLEEFAHIGLFKYASIGSTFYGQAVRQKINQDIASNEKCAEFCQLMLNKHITGSKPYGLSHSRLYEFINGKAGILKRISSILAMNKKNE
ncbi:hypothetical protein ENBRE01_1223 [Enteropsectra breve]|nr:hypothetical protein ENBRE01_1223 [Enteropsectra breve]